MSAWSDLIDIVAAEAGLEAAKRIDARARFELGAMRISIPKNPPPITAEQVENAAPGRPREAARKLGIHPTTAYRALRRGAFIR